MRQVARRLKDGRLELVEVPEPRPEPGAVAVRVEASVISAGTEGATLEVARKGLLAKARARPDQARQVIERARREGIRSTLELVRSRLEELGPLGYSAAGTVVEAGAEVRDLAPGDRVAIAGGGFANHAEVDVVPRLLCAPVPEGVEPAEAAFATLGAIAMQGFRRAEVGVGSTVAVIGLGLIGQLAVRIARAAGCRVLGVDLAPDLAELAAAGGAETALRGELGERWDRRADAVLICASAPGSDDPVRLAAALARDRAPVVVVGDVKLDIPRNPYYERELDLRLSRSYGPGRYDPAYELHGQDYPPGYVRWTEQRNLEAFLWLVAEARVRPAELISHRFPFAEAKAAFELLESGDKAKGRRPVGVLLEYEHPGTVQRPTPSPPVPRRRANGRPRFGLIGAGAFATGTIVPGLLEAGFAPAAVASAGGLSAEDTRRRFGFDSAHSDVGELLARDDLHLLVVATRHDSHARLAAAGLDAGLPVYVEKPLSLDAEGLVAVREAQARSGAPLLVGFNRRHAPLAAELRALDGPRLATFRVNAGRLPPEHWTNDLDRGGGRLLGEGCHFVDFLCDQAGADPLTVSARGFPSTPELALRATDNFSLRIELADGGVGTVNYAADAPTGPGKERFETSAPGAYAEIDDFRRGAIWRAGRPRRIGGRRQDKGFTAQYRLLADVVAGRRQPPDPASFYLSTLTTLAAARSLETGNPEPVVERGDPNGSPGARVVSRDRS